jgi:hypothetical protein
MRRGIYYGSADSGGPFTRSGDGELVNLDRVFGLLSHRYRRMILRYFYLNQRREADLDGLVRYIGDWESELRPDAAPARRDRIEVALVHNHLPRLEQMGVVDFEPETDSVRYRPYEELEQLLAAAIDISPVP